MVKKITSINSEITGSDFKEETFVDTQFTLKKIQLHIHIIREQQVILDEDLAEMYGVETKRLNEAVKRNIERFPERFMFQITQKEFDTLKHFFDTAENSECLRSQFATLKNCRGHHRKYLPLPHKSHDRFLIIDNDVYLLGASVKDMGASLCAITKMKISPDSVLALIK